MENLKRLIIKLRSDLLLSPYFCLLFLNHSVLCPMGLFLAPILCILVEYGGIPKKKKPTNNLHTNLCKLPICLLYFIPLV